jgi:hypothetical protein
LDLGRNHGLYVNQHLNWEAHGSQVIGQVYSTINLLEISDR